jgi:hypothetical protein
MATIRSLRVFMGSGGKMYPLERIVPMTETVGELKRRLSVITGVPAEEQSLIYCAKALGNDRLTMHDAGLTDDSMIHVVVRYKGGSACPEAIERKLTKAAAAALGIQLSREHDMLTLDDSDDNPRARMACGHSIAADSLFVHIKNTLQRPDTCSIRCPRCAEEWDWEAVSTVAMLGRDEKDQFQHDMAEHVALLTMGMVVCPQPDCKAWGQPPPHELRVTCRVCEITRKRISDMCVRCGRPWKGNGTKVCGNPSCVDPAKALEETGPHTEVTIYGLSGVPKVRACPRCLARGVAVLKGHSGEGCKHTTQPCARCGAIYCHVCLSVKTNGGWTCGAAMDRCPNGIAPRQRRPA